MKRKLLRAYIAGLEAESHWSHKWATMPLQGRYSRIRKFLTFYESLDSSPVLTDKIKMHLIIRKFHGHTKSQWENELSKEYPYSEIPHLIEQVWKAAQSTTFTSWRSRFYQMIKFQYLSGRLKFYSIVLALVIFFLTYIMLVYLLIIKLFDYFSF